MKPQNLLSKFKVFNAHLRRALKKTVPLVTAGLIMTGGAFARTCSCADDFDYLVKKVETNYIGYYIKVTGRNRNQYNQIKDALREKALKVSDRDCVPVLKDYLSYFRDYHLYITEAPQFSESELQQMAAATENSGMTEARIKNYLDRNASALDPIEGLWYSAKGKFAVIKDSKRQKFIGIVLAPSSGSWTAGQIIAEFWKQKAGKYKTLYYTDDHSERNLEASIHKGILLNIIGAGGGWGKTFPLKESEKNLLDPADPQSPAIKIIDKNTVLISLPSFGGAGYYEKLESLLKDNKERILAGTNLIIDLRGNGGGSRIDSLLTPFVLSGRIKQNDANLALASEDNLKVFKFLKKQRGDKASDSLTPVIEKMEANPNKIVPYKEESYMTPEVLYSAPANVAILIDRGVGSAAEAFILDAVQSSRVTLFGENTRGNIDYQQTYAFPLECKKRGLFLSYPFYTRTRTLPKGAIDYKGIPPDIRVPQNVRDEIHFVVNYYARKNSKKNK